MKGFKMVIFNDANHCESFALIDRHKSLYLLAQWIVVPSQFSYGCFIDYDGLLTVCRKVFGEVPAFNDLNIVCVDKILIHDLSIQHGQFIFRFADRMMSVEAVSS